MCLSTEYFEERAEECTKYSELGYKSIETITDTHGITLEQLADICLFKRKSTEVRITTDLYRYELTKKGCELFEFTSSQLILLKPNSIDKLKMIISDAKDKKHECIDEDKKSIFRTTISIIWAIVVVITLPIWIIFS